jgi:hypothetical protein
MAHQPDLVTALGNLAGPIVAFECAEDRPAAIFRAGPVRPSSDASRTTLFLLDVKAVDDASAFAVSFPDTRS